MAEQNRQIEISDYLRRNHDNEVLVDLRDKTSFHFGSIPNAVNIPLDRIRELYQLPHDKTIFVFCQTGDKSQEIVALLLDADYDAYDLAGGYRKYIRILAALKEDSE